ncbi:N-acetylmuramoyl-L-alanine amidase [Enterococcus gallinarum]|uniref:N-acetylmuramoyl-L-alanine amidase n=1 Tax=Enterococcus gallinarum TaxID=1353 RepID=UPI0012E0D4F7|nr:N-acetylmuramoyl-L-alanine amidase [Enterococcus gallinarum]MUN91283.1 N-acetylmuramoyl-L-alanine amidase [Enterococcus gallinarum]
MGISSLATKYQFESFGTKWSGTRNGSAITTIVVHHQAGTNFDNMPSIWRTVQASAHYGIGQDGTVRAYIDELKTAWHANNANSYSIGIECTNITSSPRWQVAEKTIDALVKLIQDIEKRYGRKMTIIGHRDAPGAVTSCPGPFLYERLEEIRRRVADNSGSNTTPSPSYAAEPWNIQQVVSTDILNVRSAQNTNSLVLRQLKRGAVFKATRITRNGENVSGITTWFEVDGNGWVSGALVTPVDHAAGKPSENKWVTRSGTVTVTAAEGINLRGTTLGDTPNPESLNILTALSPGQQVKYDRVLVQYKGHAFVRQPRAGGFGWLAIGATRDGIITSYWVSGIRI